jgi:hypothetical protein
VHSYCQLPASLAAWTMHSRRVYRLSQDLQRILLVTSLERIRWTDVLLPFPSFAIELYEPVRQDFKFILITTDYDEGDSTPFLTMRCFTESQSQYVPLDMLSRERIQTLVHRKNWREAEVCINERFRRASRALNGAVIRFESSRFDDCSGSSWVPPCSGSTTPPEGGLPGGAVAES